MKRFLIIGPPGSGKGTQSQVLKENFGVMAISTGDIFRENVKKKTGLGRKAKEYIDRGDFVPDSITNAMVRDRLDKDDVAQGFILDGYPRTVAQVKEFERMLGGVKPDAVVQLTVDQDELVHRLLARAEAEGRKDDNEQVIRYRLSLYEEQTAPVVEVYTSQGIVIKLDGNGSIDDVSKRMLEQLRFLE